MIVDDQAIIRSGLRALVESFDEFEVVAEASDGAEAVSQCRSHQPDLVLMDLRMPHVDGVGGTRRLSMLDPAPKIVVLTTYNVDDKVIDAFEAGACGFLLKDFKPQELLAGMHNALAGGRSVSSGVLDTLLRRAAPRIPSDLLACRAKLEELSDGERRVLALVGEGLTNAEIAQRLCLSAASVKTYVSRALAKLNLDNRTQAAILAYEAGLVGEAGRDRGKATL
ncbi:response regulator transcription factor [Streptomyces pathocidini]|uniref:Response regulator n=1 Tax=Streptomyces pathocidini TaxID=1650571 RepID=A0ABW7ULF8_9ACTN|nr:response regulator transcription factor [Streptomyces pathocidini]